MGTWGSGNFDSDTAADHLSVLTARLVREVEDAMGGDPVELEPDEYWGVAVPCNLEVLHVLASKGWVGVELPAAATVEAWKATFLAVWDARIDGLEPAPGHKEQRRTVLERTFDQLAEAIRAR
ncbi:hypothetical protein FB565_007529 [Actinoplanes lutulentus]|uniref:Uncharacterized protein DUF4259 n=1 Tax=Actinoplanes lutulentus TaxID=1287878 RepID=A0A327ZBV2_9ACTN|nr:DUF4259 domain-containing protein [Actinoplanes lutulentus]MBB2947758.1 hypothetical protein [Actinoplanes lutulentus]RAK29928.1 uncharacterized protein DUF4259 [Actinoplanes lutulentus]